LRRNALRFSALRVLPLMFTAEVTREMPVPGLNGSPTAITGFFPTLPDETFGYVLHPVDLAMNKVMAAAGQRELRDIVDLVTVDQTILPLGAVIWAAVEKSPGFPPEGLIAEIPAQRQLSRRRVARVAKQRTARPEKHYCTAARGPRRSRSVYRADAHVQNGSAVFASR
jgi:hypothetical protein